MTDSYKKHFKKIKSQAQPARSEKGMNVSELEKLIQMTQNKKKQKTANKLTPSRKKIVWKIPTLAFFGILVLTFALYSLEDIIKYSERLEISVFSSSKAETVEPVAENKEASPEKTLEAEASPKKNMVEELEDKKVDHLSYINDRILQLDEKEKELNKMDSELEKQRAEMDIKLKELQTLRDSISSQLKDKVEVDSQKIEGLVQMYTSMKAPQAAKVFEAMDEDLVVEILGRMKRKPAAEVMNLLKPEKAKSISEKQAGYKRR